MSLFNKTPEEKFDKALSANSGNKMLKLAEEGMQKAMINTAFRFHKGFGLKVDLNKALYWAQKASDEKTFSQTQNTLEALFTKGNIERDKGDIQAARESYKRAYEIGKSIKDDSFSYCFQCSALALALLYIENNLNLDEAKDILNELTEMKNQEAQWQLAKLSYYKENKLIPALESYIDIRENRKIDVFDDIIFDTEDIIDDYIKKVQKLNKNDVTLKDIEEMEALEKFFIEAEWDTFVAESFGELKKRLTQE